METIVKTYEGMFVLDAGNPDFEAVCEPLKAILARSEAQILSIKPWDDRRLCYEIRGRKRGLYVLVYFKLDASKVAEVEHDCQLDERILRALILRRDVLTQEQIDAPTPLTGGAPKLDEEPAPAAVEGEGVEAEIPGVDAIGDIDEKE